MSKVMVVAPIRFRIAPKLGRERAIISSVAITRDRNITLLIPKPARVYHPFVIYVLLSLL